MSLPNYVRFSQLQLETGVSVTEISNDATLADGSSTALVTENAVKVFVNSASFRLARTTTAANYTVLSSDDIVAVTDTTVARTITLSNAVSSIASKVIIVKDESGNAGINYITIDTEGSQTIDGQSSIQLQANYNSVSLYSDGTNWHIY